MGTLPNVTLKVEKWSAATGCTGAVDTSWFRIRGIPYEKISEQNVSKVASFVGLPMEIDVDNLTKFDFIRIKIGCRDVRKVPAVVNGMLDFFFYDFVFQREVPQEGTTNPAGTKWIRNDRVPKEKSSPKNRELQAYWDREVIKPSKHQLP